MSRGYNQPGPTAKKTKAATKTSMSIIAKKRIRTTVLFLACSVAMARSVTTLPRLRSWLTDPQRTTGLFSLRFRTFPLCKCPELQMMPERTRCSGSPEPSNTRTGPKRSRRFYSIESEGSRLPMFWNSQNSIFPIALVLDRNCFSHDAHLFGIEIQ
jgi:hypothetical protein